MKIRLAFVAMVAVGFALSNTGCKKGENDPSISLKSRTARLTAEWKLKSGEVVTTSTGSTTTETYNGSTRITKYSIGQITEVYTENVTIENDGSYKITTTEDTDTETQEGAWAWVNGSKEAELKNKEAVMVSPTTITSSNNTSTFTGLSFASVWVIDKLSSSELIIKISYSSSSSGYSSLAEGTMTYEKK